MATKLSWYQAMARRGALNGDELFQMQLLENGARGEAELFRLVKSVFGEDVWAAKNLWLDQQVECDVLLVTHSRIVNLNAKFYRGDFNFSKGKAYFDDKVLRSDPLAVFHTSMDRLRELVRRVGLNVPVDGLLVFMNPDYSVTVDESATFPCLARDQVRRVLKELKAESDASRPAGGSSGGGFGEFGGNGGGNCGVDIQWTGSRLLTLKSESKYGAPQMNDTHLTKLARGFVCPKCGGRHLTVGQRSVVCPCGRYSVTRSDAIWQTIEEYCLLFHDAPLVTAAEIAWFLDGSVPRRAIIHHLKSNLTLTTYGKYAAYINPHYRPPYRNGKVRNSHN